MTELALNILWLSIAVTATATWRLSWARERVSSSRDKVREFTAFACVLVLLFFAVSLTDDLHQNVLLFDESSGVRRHGGNMLRANQHGDDKAPHGLAFATLPSRPLHFAAPDFVVALFLDLESTKILTFAAEPVGRAPPLALL